MERATVLVVDDSEDVLQMLAEALSDLPYNVVIANTPEKAIKTLEKQNVAVLISDLHLSENASGNDILATAHARNPDTVSILMSGNMDREDMMTALNQGGIWKCLEKPLKLDEVRTLIQEGVQRYGKMNRPQERLKALAQKVTVVIPDGGTVALSEGPVKAVRRYESPIRENEVVAGRYRLEQLIGEGSSGKVFKAQDQLLHITVALKILASRLTSDESAIATLKAEARIAMELSHRNIVRLHNFEQAGDVYFLVMEFVEGCTLRDVLTQDGSLPLDSVTFIMRACSSALSYAHGYGVVHKDLKPENLLLSNSGLIKIIDFGLACLINAQQDEKFVAGTPIYMSPEQKAGKPVDAGCDIYALGIILYELLTGRTPFPPEASFTDIINLDPGELVGVPERIKAVLQKAIALNSADRWETIAEFCNAFVAASKA